MDLPTLLIGIIVGAIAGISFLYLYFRRILKKHSSSIPRGVSNIKRSTLKAVNKSELETAKRTLDSTLLEKELSGQALTRLYEAEVEGRITKDQRDVLSEKYRTQLKSIGDKIKTNDITLIQNSNVALQNLSSHFVNQAIFALQGSGEPNYEIAYEEFINSLKIYPKDTLGLLYGGYVAEQINKYDVALDFYKQLIEMNILTQKNLNTVYQNSINILFNHCELFDDCDSFEKSIKLITEAKNVFPKNKYYPSIEINIAMKLNKVDDARKKIDDQLKADPTNASLHFNRAVLYYNLGIALSENQEFSNISQEVMLTH